MTGCRTTSCCRCCADSRRFRPFDDELVAELSAMQIKADQLAACGSIHHADQRSAPDLHRLGRRAAARARGRRCDPHGGACAGLRRTPGPYRRRCAFRLERPARRGDGDESLQRAAAGRNPHSIRQTGQGRLGSAAALLPERGQQQMTSSRWCSCPSSIAPSRRAHGSARSMAAGVDGAGRSGRAQSAAAVDRAAARAAESTRGRRRGRAAHAGFLSPIASKATCSRPIRKFRSSACFIRPASSAMSKLNRRY